MENFNIKRFLSAKLCYVLCILISCKFGMPFLKIRFRELHEIDGKAEKTAKHNFSKSTLFVLQIPEVFGRRPNAGHYFQESPVTLFPSLGLLCFRMLSLQCHGRAGSYDFGRKFCKSFLRPKPKLKSIIASKV